MAHPLKDLTGRTFGELTVVGRVGSKAYHPTRYKHPRTSPLYGMECAKHHTCERTAASIRISGQNAKCQYCAMLASKKWLESCKEESDD
jgi:hypothetical protein